MRIEAVQYSVIVPVFNEEEVILTTYRRLKEVLDQLKESYELLFVNDGSRDQTADIITGIAKLDPQVQLINFSRNFGHQIAITAGMDMAAGQAIIVIDADLQDPPELILDMIQKWKDGYEVVYAQRMNRQGESWFKRATASGFYRILRTLTDVDIPVDTGDFRLIDRKVCDQMMLLKEKNRFVRGLVSWVGFRQASVTYSRSERYAGTSKYPLRKMLKLAWDGVTTFSEKPLKLATYLGFILSSFSFIYLFVAVYQRLILEQTVTGWASIVAISLFFNGVILMILGIIGEYIGRIYEEAKGRPLYIVESRIGMAAYRKKDETAV